MKLAEIDLLDPQLFAQSREHDAFATLRRESPMFFHPEPGDGRGFWAMTTYEHVSAVARNHEAFSSAGGTQIADRRAEGKGHPSIHNSDPPLHTALRGVTQPSFKMRKLKLREEPVRRTVQSLLNDCPRGEPFDFVEMVSIHLPMTVFGELLGVPEADRTKMVDWTNAIAVAGVNDPEMQERARAELFAYFRDLVKKRREHPEEDLTTVLAHGEIDGRPMTQEEIDPYFILLVIAGNETTRSLLSGGLEELLRHPEQVAALRADPSKLPVAIEEMVRWISPVIHMRRTALRDVEMGGETIREGDKVVLWFSSANRDEHAFPNASRFDASRTPNPHLGFGQGIHFCLGAHLARLEVRAFFEEAFRRYGRMEVLGPAVRESSNWFRGVSALPVRFS